MLTIFTPTYNRANKLPVLYKSLINQTCEDFEWIIVDDGSTDDTTKVVNRFIKESKLKITYKKTPNGGKHRAINEGVKLAKGEYFFIVDSDDYILSNAVENILKFFTKLDDSKKFAGIGTLKQCIGAELHTDTKKTIDCKNNERYLYQLLNDQAEVFFTDILRKYPFPEFENENFLLEGVVWDKLAIDGYYLRWFDVVTYMYEYCDDGLTKAKDKYKKNPNGLFEWARIELEAQKVFTTRMSIVKRVYFSLKGKYSKKEMCKRMGCKRALLSFTIIVARLLRKTEV